MGNNIEGDADQSGRCLMILAKSSGVSLLLRDLSRQSLREKGLISMACSQLSLARSYSSHLLSCAFIISLMSYWLINIHTLIWTKTSTAVTLRLMSWQRKARPRQTMGRQESGTMKRKVPVCASFVFSKMSSESSLQIMFFLVRLQMATLLRFSISSSLIAVFPPCPFCPSYPSSLRISMPIFILHEHGHHNNLNYNPMKAHQIRHSGAINQIITQIKPTLDFYSQNYGADLEEIDIQVRCQLSRSLLKDPAKTQNCNSFCAMERDYLIEAGKCVCGKEVGGTNKVVANQILAALMQELQDQGWDWDNVDKIRLNIAERRLQPVYFQNDS